MLNEIIKLNERFVKFLIYYKPKKIRLNCNNVYDTEDSTCPTCKNIDDWYTSYKPFNFEKILNNE